MSIQSEIERIQTNLSDAFAALAEKGVEVPDGSNSNALAGLIASLEVGGGASSWGTVTTSEYTNTVSVGAIPDKNFFFAIATVSKHASTAMNYIRCGYFVDQDGKKTGTMLSAANVISDVVNSASAGAVNIVLDRTANTIAFNKKSGSAAIYLEDGVTFAWFMGAI